ncbi:MAG: hypothetical protein P0S96_07350 [Simkaniaceae bacterium]|nr:hypothetical protein [Candidatus Sacchlamyda saccharinae]
MSQEEDPEMGRFHPKGDPSEPREPFLPDEMLGKPHAVPSIESMHVPASPLREQALKSFLIELKPIVENVMAVSRDDQHKVGGYLQQVKESLHKSDLSDECKQVFDKLFDHFGRLLTHSEPIDQKEALEKIRELISML